MRQDDHLELMTGAHDAMHAAEGFLQLRDADELLRRERADGNDQLRAEKSELAIEMRRAVRDLGRVGNAVAAALRIAARKAADDRADIDARAKLLLAQAEEILEPGEQPASRRIGEGTAR